MVRGKNRQVLIEKGGDLLHAKGYDATGVSEITAAAGVPKGSFYNYFKSKEAFAIEVLEHYVDGAVSAMRQSVAQGTGTSLERLRSLYEGLAAMQSADGFTRGCMIGNLCQELAGKDDVFQSAIRATMERMRDVTTEVLQDAQIDGELPQEMEIATTAAFITDAWQGALMRAKASRDTAPLDGFMALVFDRLLR